MIRTRDSSSVTKSVEGKEGFSKVKLNTLTEKGLK